MLRLAAVGTGNERRKDNQRSTRGKTLLGTRLFAGGNPAGQRALHFGDGHQLAEVVIHAAPRDSAPGLRFAPAPSPARWAHKQQAAGSNDCRNFSSVEFGSQVAPRLPHCLVGAVGVGIGLALESRSSSSFSL